MHSSLWSLCRCLCVVWPLRRFRLVCARDATGCGAMLADRRGHPTAADLSVCVLICGACCGWLRQPRCLGRHRLAPPHHWERPLTRRRSACSAFSCAFFSCPSRLIQPAAQRTACRHLDCGLRSLRPCPLAAGAPLPVLTAAAAAAHSAPPVLVIGSGARYPPPTPAVRTPPPGLVSPPLPASPWAECVPRHRSRRRTPRTSTSHTSRC